MPKPKLELDGVMNLSAVDPDPNDEPPVRHRKRGVDFEWEEFLPEDFDTIGEY